MDRYEKGTATPEERKQVEQWYASLDEAGDAGEPFDGNLEKAAVRDGMWEHVSRKMAARSQGRGKVIVQRRMRLLAAATVAGVICLAAYFLQKKVSYQASAPLKYLAEATGPEVKRIALSDGSVMWLNSYSRVRYPADLELSRELDLETGEAYFEVAPHEQLPFIVRAANGITARVLGTSFSVKAYQQTEVKVLVKTGKVQVHSGKQLSGVLGALEGIEVGSGPGGIKQLRLSGDMIDGWRAGRTVLENAGFEELAHSLRNMYGVKVQLATGLRHCRISISFSKQDSLQNVLNALERIYRIKCYKKDSTITVTGRPCQP